MLWIQGSHASQHCFKKSNFFWCSSRDFFSLYSLIANSHFMFIMSVYQISCSKSGSHTSQCSSVGHTHQVLMIIISWILLKSQVHTLHWVVSTHQICYEFSLEILLTTLTSWLHSSCLDNASNFIYPAQKSGSHTSLSCINMSYILWGFSGNTSHYTYQLATLMCW